jgi:hypothetical protein
MPCLLGCGRFSSDFLKYFLNLLPVDDLIALLTRGSQEERQEQKREFGSDKTY